MDTLTKNKIELEQADIDQQFDFMIWANELNEPTLPQPNQIMRADLMPDDEKILRRSADFIGKIALDDVYIKPTEDIAPNTSLLVSAQRAEQGNEEARLSVRMNVKIAVIEAMIKSGHITRVNMNRDEHGNWLQHGAAMLHVHANALRSRINKLHPGLLARTKAETDNGHRIEDYGQTGLLDSHYLFVPSLIPEETEVPFKIATQKAGFFGDTMTAAFQLTSTDGKQGMVESAFVKGVINKGDQRFDIEAMRKMYALAGYDATGWQPIDFLSNPLLIPKEQLPNGITDIMELYYQLSEETVGPLKIDGRQDYDKFVKTCLQREASLEGLVDDVLAQLLEKGREVSNPDAMVSLLAKLVSEIGVEHAVKNSKIDPTVFGFKASQQILIARHYLEAGKIQQMNQAMLIAQKVAITSTCGVTFSNSSELSKADIAKFISDVEQFLRGETVDNDVGNLLQDCEFTSKECPQCHTKNVKTTRTSDVIRGACKCEFDIKLGRATKVMGVEV